MIPKSNLAHRLEPARAKGCEIGCSVVVNILFAILPIRRRWFIENIRLITISTALKLRGWDTSPWSKRTTSPSSLFRSENRSWRRACRSGFLAG
ncbi:hypothetical protein Trco_007372 [Trichoderma cornu-damae]|uniref:Uncharacterized protein n=1 Tax=Trichoderma cornu-damae TaxID=654480 RepID=A0A9P8QE96_9HYPO|nr:hypothetical protein Trco_007372 [Trichoderma cornu-damae]